MNLITPYVASSLTSIARSTAEGDAALANQAPFFG